MLTNPSPLNDEIPLTEAAHIAGVVELTLRRWIRSGRIAAKRVPGPRRLVVSRAALLRLMQGTPVLPATPLISAPMA